MYAVNFLLSIPVSEDNHTEFPMVGIERHMNIWFDMSGARFEYERII